MLQLAEFEGAPIRFVSEEKDSIVVRIEYKGYYLEIRMYNSDEAEILNTNMKRTQLEFNYSCIVARKEEIFRNYSKSKEDRKLDLPVN